MLVLVFLWIRYLKHREENLPGASVQVLGRNHVPKGAAHSAYNSNPPTSGDHYDVPAEWGVYKEPLEDEQLIHNLEHGGVWIAYKPDISKDIITKLEGMVKKYGKKVIVAPRPVNDSDVAVAVWGRLDKFSVAEYSDERVENFIESLRNKTAPEPWAP